MENEQLSRRALLGSVTVAALAAQAAAKPRVRPKEWKPRLGVLGQFTTANLDFAVQAGYNNMILSANAHTTLDANTTTAERIQEVKSALAAKNVTASALQINASHIDPNPERRARDTDYFAKAIEMAGHLDVPYIGTQSGKDETKTFPEQVDEIVRVYHEKYFANCEKYNVKILWEPWPGGANIATGPVGFEALFKAFGDTPYVGLQYDPSHLVWQMMDPIQTAQDFVDKIYDVHLKDTQIHWDILKRGGIQPVDKARWWQYRIPGMGCIKWNEFFSVLQAAGYQGAMSIEHEDDLYGAGTNHGPDFSDEFKVGFRMAKRYLDQYVPV